MLQTANETLQNQIMVFQALGEGDWYGFMDAMNYQAQAIGGALGTLEAYDVVAADIGFLNELEGQDLLRADMAALRDSTRNTHLVLRSGTQTVENIILRTEAMGVLQNRAAGSDSMLEVLQLQSQQMALVTASLHDLNHTMYTMQVAEANKISHAEIRMEIIKTERESFGRTAAEGDFQGAGGHGYRAVLTLDGDGDYHSTNVGIGQNFFERMMQRSDWTISLHDARANRQRQVESNRAARTRFVDDLMFLAEQVNETYSGVIQRANDRLAETDDVFFME